MCEPLKISIVDDDKEIREMLVNMIEDWKDEGLYDIDIEIKQYENGKDMIDDFKTKKWYPHLCCVDYQMDCGNGSYIISEMKKISRNHNILMITAWPNTEDIKRISKECVVIDKIDPETIETALRVELDMALESVKVKYLVGA